MLVFGDVDMEMIKAAAFADVLPKVLVKDGVFILKHQTLRDDSVKKPQKFRSSNIIYAPEN